LQTDCDYWKAQFDNVQTQGEYLTAICEDLQSECEYLRAQNFGLQTEHYHLREQCAALQTELDQLRDTNTTTTPLPRHTVRRKRKHKNISMYMAPPQVKVWDLIEEMEDLSFELHETYKCYEECIDANIPENIIRDAKLVHILFCTILDLLFSRDTLEFVNRSTHMKNKIK
jgi:FtsZ-binding cell division protein ZapB